MSEMAQTRAYAAPTRMRPRQADGPRNRPAYVNRSLLLVRVLVGLLFIGHGLQKLAGWFGGPGMTSWTQSVAKEGLQPAAFWAGVSAWGEFGAGIFLVLGFLTPLAASFLIADMLMAILKVHAAKGLWSEFGGYEYNLVLIILMVALALMGPGLYSLDGRLPFRLNRAAIALAAIVLAIAGTGYALLGLPVPF
ncbi:MAG TPA: DoxX family protein [Chloroflexota bacterium]|nr:DoxX family protein [Chloroflexota bacterium]